MRRLSEVARIGSQMVDPRVEPYLSLPHVGPENIESDTGYLSGVRSARDCGLISAKYTFDERAIVYSKIRPNLNKVAYPHFRGVSSADAYPLWADESLILPEFLEQLLRSPSFVKQAVSVSARTGMPKINRQDLGRLLVPVPPLERQQVIATALTSLDRVSSLIRELAVQMRARKRGIMSELLTGQRRLPEFAKSSWGRRALEDLLMPVSRPVQWNDNTAYQLLSVRRRSGGTFLREKRLGSQIKSKGLFTVERGDFIISRMQVAHGALALVRSEHAATYVSATYDVLRARDDSALDIRFFDYLSRLPATYRKVRLACHGVHIEKMTFNLGQFLRSSVVIPDDIAEQRGIADFLDLVDAEERLMGRSLEEFKKLKVALMDRLFGSNADR